MGAKIQKKIFRRKKKSRFGLVALLPEPHREIPSRGIWRSVGRSIWHQETRFRSSPEKSRFFTEGFTHTEL